MAPLTSTCRRTTATKFFRPNFETVFASGALFCMMTIRLFLVGFINMLCCVFFRFLIDLFYNNLFDFVFVSLSYLINFRLVFFCFCSCFLLSNLQVEMSGVSKRDHAPPTGQTPGILRSLYFKMKNPN